MKFEKSCGVVLFHRKNGRIQILLLKHHDGHWDFVKGHKEEEETDEETALREITEETGIREIRLLVGFKEGISYSFKHGNEKINKDVIFFLGETKEDQVQLSGEHGGYSWETPENALEKLTFENAKGVLKKAIDYFVKSTN